MSSHDETAGWFVMARPKCKATKADGTPCRSFAVSDAGWCVSHDPDRQESNREASRRGGENRSAYRRAARQWAAAGQEIEEADLPALIRATIIDVREGRIEPSVATAIAQLAKTAVQLTNDLELTKRIEALEEAAGLAESTGKIRRLA
jgi:hypothetical protein